MVGLIRDNGKVLFSMTVVADPVVDASSGGAGCGALAATGTNGASDADGTGVAWKVVRDRQAPMAKCSSRSPWPRAWTSAYRQAALVVANELPPVHSVRGISGGRDWQRHRCKRCRLDRLEGSGLHRQRLVRDGGIAMRQ